MLVLAAERITPELIGRVGYLQVLADRFGTEALGILLVLPPQVITDDPLMVESVGDTAPAVIVTASEAGMSDAADSRVWLVSPGGAVSFAASAGQVEDRDLRQVVEKALTGTATTYDRRTAQPLRPGSPFPQLSALQVLSGEIQTLRSGAYDRLVVFNADCTVCTLSTYFGRLQEHRADLAAGERRVAALFSRRFSPQQLILEATLRQVDTPILVARQEITGLEDGYYLESLISPVVVVDLGADGRVEAVRTFQEFLGGDGDPESPAAG